jgi:hypothetical protein
LIGAALLRRDAVSRSLSLLPQLCTAFSADVLRRIDRFGDTMIFQSVSPSAVKSIRQRDFLKEWMRHYAPERSLPSFAKFKPARIEDEKPDLMFYEIDYVDREPRYRVTFEGHRLIDAYGISGLGRHLQDTISPGIWVHLEPIYAKCVAAALPVYSTFQVTDTEGRKVDYERLLLPFGESGIVHNMITSLQSICEEGRFVNTGLMRPDNHDPKYTLRAVIDGGLSAPSRPTAIAGDIVAQ